MKIFLYTKVCVLFLSMNSIAHAQDDYKEAQRALDTLISDVINSDKDLTKAQKEEKPTHYITKYGDTLDQIIIDHVEKMPIRKDILKRAIVNANRNCFNKNNPNWMYSGCKLKLPDVDDLSKLIFTDAERVKMLKGKDQEHWVRYP